MGNSKLERTRAPSNARLGEPCRASRNSIQPKGLAGDHHA